MLDLVFAVAADPMAIPLWAVVLFAAGMYPIGFMLGAECSPCCGVCGCAPDDPLPDTLTVTFDNLTNQTPGPDLISLSFSSCYGSGAAARVTAPGGDPEEDAGPISAVSLTNAGSGYAKLGRVQPTVTLGGGSGTGATFSVTLSQEQDACKIDYWKVSAISVTGGTGFADGEALTFTVAEGDTEEQAASATVQTTRAAPTLTASVSPGSGASLSVTVVENEYASPATWYVSEVTLSGGGTGYVDGSQVTFTLGSGDIAEYNAAAVIQTNRLEPTITASVSSENGSGADLSVTLSQTTDWEGRDIWSVASIGVTDGGTGYVEGDVVSVTVTDGTSSPYNYFDATVSSVDENGAITGVVVNYGGEYFKDGGVIQSVLLFDGGSYYNDSGVPTGVTLTGGGIYYREDATATPYVADVTVTVASQGLPSDGTGATFIATVEDDTSSPDFGKIVALAIDDGGDGYLAWKWANTKCCGDYYNGMSVVVKRNNYNQGPCVYEHRLCGVGNMTLKAGRVVVLYSGSSQLPVVQLISESNPEGGVSSICNTTFTATSNVTQCSQWNDGNGGPLTFAAPGGATATVTTGGDYDATFRNPGGRSCFICCKGEEAFPEEIEIDVAGGVYVQPVTLTQDWRIGWGGSIVNTEMRLCASQTPFEFGGAFDNCGEDCHKKCRVMVEFRPNGVYGPFYYGDLAYGDGCGCAATPMCNPYGTYTLINGLDETDTRTATISAPL